MMPVKLYVNFIDKLDFEKLNQKREELTKLSLL